MRAVLFDAEHCACSIRYSRKNFHSPNNTKLTFIFFLLLLLYSNMDLDCVITGYLRAVRHGEKNCSGRRQDLFIFVHSTMNDSLFVQWCGEISVRRPAHQSCLPFLCPNYKITFSFSFALSTRTIEDEHPNQRFHTSILNFRR